MKLSVSFTMGITVSLLACQKQHAQPPRQTIPPKPTGTSLPSQPPAQTTVACEVIVAGGSTAALSAALTAAREGAQTCLVEPTDWPGGQLTAAGVPAVDFAWHKANDSVDVGKLGRQPENIPAELLKWLSGVGNPGNCWVSRYCFSPKDLLNKQIFPALRAEQANLTVILNAVVKRVHTTGEGSEKIIDRIDIVQRTPKTGSQWPGYTRRLSQALPDWYAQTASEHFDKKVASLVSPGAQPPVVIDATEFGDVLVLAGAPYLVGVESDETKLGEGNNERCGQAFTFTFAISTAAKIQPQLPEEALKSDHPSFFSLGKHSWTKVWTYRRLLGTETDANVEEISLQNWNPGNDYPFGYPFKGRSDTQAELNDWQGGLNLQTLDAAERHAYGYFSWYKGQAPSTISSQMQLASNVLGTEYGLSRIPYIRDGRRSIGLDNFVIKSSDLYGSSTRPTGTNFADSIGIGAYALDIHPMQGGCTYPKYIAETYPYYLPFRAHTNRDFKNLLVAGKAMAQTFMANAATRLHPVEFASGVGAGAAAAYMWKNALSSRQAYQVIPAIQKVVQKHAPIQWSIGGGLY